MVAAIESIPVENPTPKLSLSHEELELLMKLLKDNEQEELADKYMEELKELGYTEPIKNLFMAFRDFKNLQAIKKTFGVQVRQFNLFPDIELFEPTEKLKQQLEEGIAYAPITEKERSESLIYPILNNFKLMSLGDFDLYSGRQLRVEKDIRLRGECDFLYAFSDVRDYVECPIFATIEAKETMIRQGTAQCAAQMIGIKALNEQEETPLEVVYGCVTTGYDWRFMKLEKGELSIDTQIYSTKSEMSSVLGIWKAIVEGYSVVKTE
ncbi:MAG: hypothetical protein AB8B69_22940 [Chitinophagales bacterium]